MTASVWSVVQKRSKTNVYYFLKKISNFSFHNCLSWFTHLTLCLTSQEISEYLDYVKTSYIKFTFHHFILRSLWLERYVLGQRIWTLKSIRILHMRRNVKFAKLWSNIYMLCSRFNIRSSNLNYLRARKNKILNEWWI